MVYVVERGDTLRKIADRHGSTIAAFLSANPDLADPDRIHPGQLLTIPEADASQVPNAVAGHAGTKEGAATTAGLEVSTYEVQSGDSMKRIASRFSIALSDLIAANPQVGNPDEIRRGQVLAIPGPEADRPSAAARPGPSTTPKGESDGPRARHGAIHDRAQDWSTVPVEDRTLYVMERLVRYGYPVNGAAGILGNLFVESGVLPNRIQGSLAATPMRAKDFNDVVKDFTAEEVMLRDEAAHRGPRLPGIGLAQWTWGPRRAGLFAHAYGGTIPEREILFNMDAQIDYLVTELRGKYKRVERVVVDPGVAVDEAADEVLYEFEVPRSVIGADGKLPRTNHAVRDVFETRRAHARRARTLYGDKHDV